MPELFLSLAWSKFIMIFSEKFCEKSLFHFFVSVSYYTFLQQYQANLTRSSSSGKVGSCKTLTMLHHRDLLKNLKEKILTKVSYLKLLKKENLNGCLQFTEN